MSDRIDDAPPVNTSTLALIAEMRALRVEMDELTRRQQTTSITVRLMQDVADERFDRLEQARAGTPAETTPRLETDQWMEVRS